LAILAFGPLLYEALQAAESLDATVVNMRWAKPLDLDMLEQVAQQHERLITLEDGVRMGGAGAAVLEALQDMGIHKPVLVMGFEDAFTEHGDSQELMQHYGLTAAGIHQRMAKAWPKSYATPMLRKVV
jgi:1-deoxy-D-xylulose-5-phosphate synthase